MNWLWIVLGVIAAVAVGIWIGIKLFENAARDAIEGLTGRKAS